MLRVGKSRGYSWAISYRVFNRSDPSRCRCSSILGRLASVARRVELPRGLDIFQSRWSIARLMLVHDYGEIYAKFGWKSNAALPTAYRLRRRRLPPPPASPACAGSTEI